LGRYRGAAGGNVTVRAQDAAARPWSQAVPARVHEGGPVAVVWARGQVRELEDRYAAGQGNPAALEKEIVATSLRFGVLCRFTAFVAVDVKEVVSPGGRVQRVTQPVESASGWAMLGTDAETIHTRGAGGFAKSMLCAPSAAIPPGDFDLALESL